MLALLPWIPAVAPLVVVPGLADFARFPQQVFIQICAVVLVLVWALGGTRARPGTRGMKPLDVPLGLFLVLSALSLGAGPDRAAGLGTLAHWTSCALVYWMVSRLVQRPAQARPLLAGVFAGAVAVALMGLAQGLLRLDLVPSAAGPAGTLANRNAAAGYLVMALPLGLALWAGGTRTVRLSAAIGASVVAAFLPFTLARAAAVALAVQLLILWRLRSKLSPRETSGRRPIVGEGWGWIVVAGAVVLLGSAICLTTVSPAKARSLSIRLSLAQSALTMAAERPALGVGLGRFGDEYAHFGEPIHASGTQTLLRVESAHNEPLHVLAETGLPGFLALVWIAGAAVSTLRRLHGSPDSERRATATAVTLSLVGFAVDGLAGFPLRTAVGPLGVAVLLGLVASLDDPIGPRAVRGAVASGRRGALGAAAPAAIALSLLPAMGWAVHLQESPLLPETSASEADACSLVVDVTIREGDRLDLVAEDVPLAEVLACLAERTGMRLEIDGAPPAQRVSATFRDEALATVVTELLAGLGVDYLMGFDPTGARLERVILVEDSGLTAPGPRSSARPEAGRPPVTPGRTRDPRPGSRPDLGPPTEDPAGSAPGFTFGPGRAPDRYRPPVEEGEWGGDDPTPGPELSPMTLRRPWNPFRALGVPS